MVQQDIVIEESDAENEKSAEANPGRDFVECEKCKRLFQPEEADEAEASEAHLPGSTSRSDGG